MACCSNTAKLEVGGGERNDKTEKIKELKKRKGAKDRAQLKQFRVGNKTN